MQSFVALDLELTPFPGCQQRIIEIAGVRFRQGQVVDSFSTLVDPRCGLDYRIGALTGIQQGELDSAPCLETLAPRLIAFVGDDPIVGQSIELDIQQLAAQGIPLTNASYDTYALASLLIQGLPSYDLGTIARSLGIDWKQEHRALDDAVAAARVFLALVSRASELGLPVLTRVVSLGAQIPGWQLGELFRELQRETLRDHFLSSRSGVSRSWEQGREVPETGRPAPDGEEGWEPKPPSDPPQRLSPRPAANPAPLDSAELCSLLRPGGPVSQALPGFEEREEQLHMVQAVVNAVNLNHHLVVEAGTGTGKSLAYLLPAIYHAVRHGRPVVVSTNTINLQDQLFHKDIPTLQGCLPVQFKAALLKGRANYLCIRRWFVLSRSSNLSPAEASLALKTLVWLSTTETGDRAELNLTPSESALWSRISAQGESCALGDCQQFRSGRCFVTRARRNAESAHVVVVNHALLLSDLARAGGVLPEYSHAIIDEAHHLEEEATEQLGYTFCWADLSSFLSGLHQPDVREKPAGFLPDLLTAVQLITVPGDTLERIRSTIAASQAAVELCMDEGRSFFESLSLFLSDQSADRSQSGNRLRVTSATRAQPGWSEVEVRWSELSDRAASLVKWLLQLETRIETMDGEPFAEREGVMADLAGFIAYLQTLRIQGEEIVCSPGENGIYWTERGSQLPDLALRSAPLHVGEVLNSALFSQKSSVILTSATMTAEGSFDYVKERLGLEDAQELVLGSPFDYKKSTLLYVVRDIPEPARPSHQKAVESTIADLVTAVEGRTLVLFTSHAQLRTTSAAIRNRLEERGIGLLVHGVDGSRRRLLQNFKAGNRTVLMGTSSFWEGIDVVGEALSCVVIVKLPFAVPTDPIFAARSEGFDEPFRQYSMPQTILRFKQGFGRLIRSGSDRGVVVVLDSRVGSKFYGPSFIHSLPECTIHMGCADHLAETARSWLSGQPTSE